MNTSPAHTRKVYILTSAWHIGDLSVRPENRVTVFVGPPAAVIGHFVPCAPGAEWVLSWLKTEGASVRAGERIAELRNVGGERRIPLPSPVGGVLAEIRARRGIVPPRSVVAVINARIRRKLDQPSLAAGDHPGLHDFLEFRG